MPGLNLSAIRGGELKGVESRTAGSRFVGMSCAFGSIMETIETVGPRECSVMITGETGTGKEMVAQQIHRSSKRSERIFVPVDCSALSEQLFESQLFGHTKGSFTGAISDTLGFFRAADGGTIFLDEIGELGLDLQVKLLRVLQEGCVTPLGSTKSYPVDVRLICATNRDLRQMVKDESFRLDLYFRLNVIQIEVPPLRQRKDDILLLCEYFLSKQSKLYSEPVKRLSPSAKKLLLEYNWPGNVREVSNAMEHAYILSSGDMIQPFELPIDLIDGCKLGSDKEDFLTLDDVKKKHVERALETTKGRKMLTAKLLGVDHRKLSRLIEKYELYSTWK